MSPHATDSLPALLEQAFSLGITFSLEDEQLALDAPEETDIEAFVAQIKAHKPEIRAFVRRRDDGLRLLTQLQFDSVWMPRGNVLYQGVYMPRPDYIVLMRRLFTSGNQQDYTDASSELVRQQMQLQALKEQTSVKPALAQATIDECWHLIRAVHDWFLRSPPPHGVVFWYGPGTGYPNELVSSQDYIARATACLESGEPGRIYAAMTALHRTKGKRSK